MKHESCWLPWDMTEQYGQNWSLCLVVKWGTKMGKKEMNWHGHKTKSEFHTLLKAQLKAVYKCVKQSDLKGGKPEDELIDSTTLINLLPGTSDSKDSCMSCVLSHSLYRQSLKALVWSSAQRLCASHVCLTGFIDFKTVDSVSRWGERGGFQILSALQTLNLFQLDLTSDLSEIWQGTRFVTWQQILFNDNNRWSLCKVLHIWYFFICALH